MANAPTPASVASRLTDNEILNLAEQHTRIDSGSLPQFVVDRCTESAAVLRDYVRLRRLVNAMVERCDDARAKIAKHNNVFREVWGHDDVFDGNKLIDYILKGATDERK